MDCLHQTATLTCRIQPPGWLLGLVLDFPPLAFITALGFLFFPPLAIIQPLVFSSSHPWLLFSRWFWFLPTLGYYSALGFIFFPPLATIQPWVFTLTSPWLLSHPRFFTFVTLGFSSEIATSLFPCDSMQCIFGVWIGRARYQYFWHNSHYGHTFWHLRPRTLDLFKIPTSIFVNFTITACMYLTLCNDHTS